MVHYEVKEVDQKWQLDGIADVLWAAMDGVEPSHAIFFPTLGSEAQDRDRAIAESKNRLWKGHEMDPSSHWIYVLEGDRIVGGCQWRIYMDNPFPDPSARVNATFWPEGTGRDFASEVARISLMCVLPEKQRQGIGVKLMEWGLRKMDERDIEGFVEASVRGRLLYRNFGFLDVAYVRVNMEHDDLQRTEPWRALELTSLPIDYTAMWRPRQGRMPAAEAKQTWQQRLQIPVRAHVEELI
ncbi:hypothetical protein N0V90_012517 [Kalmusia sp. IMI 367209]|nr:hypothetical protein N0V90_012517 [Kalmusia sp. IMI 367209]